jgi:hypothetical protein
MSDGKTAHAREWFLYVLGPARRDYVKIGVSGNPHKRLKTLATAMQNPWHVPLGGMRVAVAESLGRVPRILAFDAEKLAFRYAFDDGGTRAITTWWDGQPRINREWVLMDVASAVRAVKRAARHWMELR